MNISGHRERTREKKEVSSGYRPVARWLSPIGTPVNPITSATRMERKNTALNCGTGTVRVSSGTTRRALSKPISFVNLDPKLQPAHSRNNQTISTCKCSSFKNQAKWKIGEYCQGNIDLSSSLFCRSLTHPILFCISKLDCRFKKYAHCVW